MQDWQRAESGSTEFKSMMQRSVTLRCKRKARMSAAAFLCGITALVQTLAAQPPEATSAPQAADAQARTILPTLTDKVIPRPPALPLYSPRMLIALSH